MEGVERTNAIIVCSNQEVVFIQCNPYAMNVNRGRNCYSRGGFDYLAQNCRKQIMDQERRMEYEDNCNNRQSNINRGEI